MTITGLLVAALLMQEPTWSISGRILNADGSPAAKVTVAVFRVGDPTPGLYSPVITSADSAADGKYLVKSLPPGRYRVMAGILGQATWFPGVFEESEGNVVVLSGNADLDNIDFRLIRPATLEIGGKPILEIVKRFEMEHARGTNVTETITALRTRFNARYLMRTATALTVRESPARVALAERLIRDFDKTAALQGTDSIGSGLPDVGSPFLNGVGFDANQNVYLLEPGTLRELNPTRSQLRASGPISLSLRGDVRAAFEALAEKADMNVVLDPRIDGGSAVAYAFDAPDVRDAFDQLAKRSATYWQALDHRTVLVAPETPAAHQTMDQQVFRTFYLTNADNRGLVEIVTGLRTILNMRYVASVPYLFAISLRDTPARIALAEKMIADMDKLEGPSTAATSRAPLEPSEAMTMDALGNLTQMDAAGVRNVSAGRDQLVLRSRGPISVQSTKDVRELFQDLASQAGIAVQFDPALAPPMPVRFRIKDADILDALDLLSLQTRTFWHASDSRTITVAPNTPEIRQRVTPKSTVTLSFTHLQDEASMTTVLNGIRILLNTREAELLAGSRAIMLTDTPNTIALARKIVADLDRPKR